jgi:NAD(P)-dependent dehydrogenase (short-subunit alcohol dehydrogenase family)
MKNLFDISGRVVIVTGALGQLGKQFALTLLEQGARVAALDLNVANAEKVYSEYSRHENLLFLAADVTNRASLESALSQIEAKWETPFGLVNNAGLDSPPGANAAENGPFEDYPEASFDKVMSVNVKGVMLCCQVFGAAMAREKRGSIINISSIYGMVSPDQTIYEYRRERGETFFKPVAYSASKSALFNLTRYVATYWAKQNVRVNTLTFAGVWNNQDEEFLRNYNARIPLGRMAREDEYTGAVVFLVSDAASYMTGSNMILDGGWTAI